MKILFVTNPYPNYVPDLLLHGLRKLLGPEVVDYPKKNCLYQGVLGLGVCAEDQLCPGWFPADENMIDREEIPRKVAGGYFDLVICDARAAQFINQTLGGLPKRLAVVDGEDRPIYIPPGPYLLCRRETDGIDFSIPLPMALPEEILHWISAYDGLPKQYSIGFLGSNSDGIRRNITDTLLKYYPDALLQTSAVPNHQSPNPDGRMGRDSYYRSLQQCRLVLSMAGAGYDTFRYWEHAACNAIHIAHGMPILIPNNFKEQKHIFRFKRIDELRKLIDHLLEEDFDYRHLIDNARVHLKKYHLTTGRAKYFLDRVMRAYKIRTWQHLCSSIP